MLGSGMMKFFAPSEGEKNLDFFIEEVRRVKSENMMGDTAAMDSSSAAAAAAELVPSFQQVPGHRVEAHSHQDLGALRDMELIVHRWQSVDHFIRPQAAQASRPNDPHSPRLTHRAPTVLNMTAA